MINESEEEIVRTLLQQCALLPEQLQQYCRLVVNLYAKDLIDYVRTRIGEPRTLCQRIGICRTEESEKTPVSKKTSLYNSKKFNKLYSFLFKECLFNSCNRKIC